MKTMVLLLVFLMTVIASAETSEQVISRLQLNVDNLRVDVGGFCLLPGFNNINKSCVIPLDKATDFILTLQNKNTQMETMDCNLKAAGQFQDIVCVVNIFVQHRDAKGCPYQRATYEIKVASEADVQLVSKTPYKYYCDGGGY